MSSNLAQRIGFALIAIPVALGVVWYGGLPLVSLVVLVSVLGVRELYDIAARLGIEPLRTLGFLAAALFPVLTYLALQVAPLAHAVVASAPYLLALWVLAVLAWALAARSPGERPLGAVAVTVLGALYAGGLPAFLLVIRHAGHGAASWAAAWLVFFPLVVTWVCDTAAMFGGKAIGGPRLAPTISPGKTRSGAAAGFVAAVLAAPLYHGLALAPHGIELTLPQLLGFGGLLGVVGQVGDLAESLFKREAGIKDSSALIPGHGGVLDRFDSLYFVLPVAAAFYRCIGVIP